MKCLSFGYSAAVAALQTGPQKQVLALVGFTFIVWLGRIRNVVLDDTLSGFDFAWSLGIAIVFLALAAAALAGNRSESPNLWARALAMLSVGYWSVRGVQIAFADHETAFIVVHSVLARTSVILGAWVLLKQLRESQLPNPT